MTPVIRRSATAVTASAVLALDAHLVGPYVTGAASVVSRPALLWVAIAFAAEVFSLVAAAQLQRRMLAASGLRVPLPTTVGLTYAAYALTMSVPAGSAVSTVYTFRRLRALGATTPSAGFTLLSTGVLSTLAYAPLVALAGFALAGGSTVGPLGAVGAAAAGALLVLGARAVLRHPRIVERAGARALQVLNRARRRDRDAGVDQLRQSTRTLAAIHPAGRDWAVAMAAALINWVADLGCLIACCLAVGADGTTLGVVLPAYLAGTSISGISVVPAGLGVVDAALILVLVGNGVGAGHATAAVLLYRVLSLGFGLLAGWSAWIGHACAVRRAANTPARVSSWAPRSVRPRTPSRSGRRVGPRSPPHVR